MPRLKIRAIALFLLIAGTSYAQNSDTVYINPSHISTSQLKDGKSVYLVYFRKTKDAPRTMTQFWTREVRRKSGQNGDMIEITQSWEDKDSIIHTARSLCDAATFRPILHESWWNRKGVQSASAFDYASKKASIDGNDLLSDTAAKSRQMAPGFLKATEQYHLNWHLDLEVFATLPFVLHRTFCIPFYEAGYKEPENIRYTVTGEGKLTGYNRSEVDCWILQHETKDNKEQYWISKKTNEVLKLEQEVNGSMYRYKIRLGFSDL